METQSVNETECNSVSLDYDSAISSKAAVNEKICPELCSSLERDGDAEMSEIEPYIQFQCSICYLNEKCIFGELKASDGFYPSAVFYMRDPFEPPQRIKGRKPILSDFLVIGSFCSLCNQSVCLDKTCSIYFGALFCTTCITRERRRFPDKVLQMVAKAQSLISMPK
ncbi:hypothetical protein DICVIV_01576 [Dictyocaulus viviparus]|uniref:Cysteine-rich DPF motif domain-containing protein 1 n=1 Tax=Dictyocaulus viviparus TaxID=29172 RepID=A0A0D8Y5Z3_DICVI|nr:hypothetical protein DICVIV_01576 [Dictyocaulus viviparus]